MPTDTNTTGGATTPATVTTVTETKPATVSTPADVVARADHERATSDMLKYKQERDQLRAEIEAQKTAKLKETNDYKTLAERLESENATLKTNNQKIQDAIIEEKRTSALKAKVSALGLRPEAESDLEMLDLSALRIETTSTGKINVLGVGEYAERLKASKPHWFADKTAPNVNTTGSRVLDSGDAITPQDLIAAERDGRKTKDMSKYRELHAKYQLQRSGRSG